MKTKLNLITALAVITMGNTLACAKPQVSQASSPSSSSTPLATPMPLKIVVKLANPKMKAIVGKNPIVFIATKNGKPMMGAKWIATVTMVTMDMGTTHPKVKVIGHGHYGLLAQFAMAGPWKVDLSTMVGKSTFHKAFTFDAGKESSKVTGMNSGSMMDGGGHPAGLVPMNSQISANFSKSDSIGFGKNSTMVGMMNMMMVGGSGMESMKMPVMNMSFGSANYSAPASSVPVSSASLSVPVSSVPISAGSKTPSPVSSASNGQNGSMGNMDMSGMKAESGGQVPAPIKGSVILIELSPKSIVAGSNLFRFELEDAHGKMVHGYKINLTVFMATMDMGTTHPVAKEIKPGIFESDIKFAMAGPWKVSLKASKKGAKSILKVYTFTAH